VRGSSGFDSPYPNVLNLSDLFVTLDKHSHCELWSLKTFEGVFKTANAQAQTVVALERALKKDNPHIKYHHPQKANSRAKVRRLIDLQGDTQIVMYSNISKYSVQYNEKV
jgi:hypothetical protein